ncbi:MAG: cupin domain-containing protein [Myxococcota bacterium]
MMRNVELPEFLREACDENASGLEVASELASELPRLLKPLPASGRERLLHAVEPLPLRFAPFFSRIATLWDLPCEEVEAILSRAADPASWRKPGLPGLKLVDVTGGRRVQDARVTLVRFAAGMHFPAHRHPGPEALFVLEGCYHDCSGRRVGPGDLHEMPPGSEHSFRVGRERACVAASVQFGQEFTGTLMKFLIRVFG